MSDPSLYQTPIKSQDPDEATNQRTLDRWAKYLRDSIWPIGIVRIQAGTNPSPDWLFCNGNSYPTATYPRLFKVIGYSYGGSGANFNVPNLISSIPIGQFGLIGSHTNLATSTSSTGITATQMNFEIRAT